MSYRQRLEQIEKARQVQRVAALDRLLGLLPPEEAEMLEATLEAELIGLPVPPDVGQRAGAAFARAWAAMTPSERAEIAGSITDRRSMLDHGAVTN